VEELDRSGGAPAGGSAEASPGPPARPSLRPWLLLVAGVTAMLACFAGKAFSVDDPVYVWVARQIAAHPLDFYGFAVNWYGTAAPMYEVNRNPPLVSYWLALVAQALGWSEWALHVALLPVAAGAAAAMAALARRLCAHPFQAAWIAVLTPAFLVMATAVTCDVLMLALWCGALSCWLRGWDSDRHRWWWAAGALAGAAALAKYFGVALVPLLLLHGWLRARRLGAWTAALALPLVSVIGFELVTRHLYGSGLILDAARYAAGFGERAPGPAERALVTLAFAGGAVAVPLTWAAALLGRTQGLAAAVAWLGLAAASPLLLPALGLPWAGRPGASLLAGQLWAMVLGGLGAIALCVDDWRRRPGPESALLGAWVLGTLAFVGGVNWTQTARAVLPMAPAVAILAVRRLEAGGGLAGPRRAAAFALSASLALAVAWADARWAGEVRTAARRIAALHAGPDGRLLFQGHWGFQFYLEQAGARAMDLARDEASPGDRVAVAANNYGVPAWRLDPGRAELLEEFAVFRPRWLRTMSPSVGAAFYASERGPLPFAFGRSQPDRYRVWRARRPLRFGGEAAGATGSAP